VIIYKFLNETRALEALRNRRLKLSLINELNDPFEFMAVDLQDTVLRRTFNRWKTTFSNDFGILCFSTKWSNPLLWSHYADRHKGLCLAFEAQDELLEHIDYTHQRIVPSGDWV